MLNKFRRFIRKYPILTTIFIGIALAVIFNRLNRHGLANGLLFVISLTALVPALIDMNHTFKSGYYGINILPLTALLTALVLQQYWTAVVLALILAGERPLVTWFRSGSSEMASAMHAPFVKLLDRFSVPFTILVFLIGGSIWIVSGEVERFLEIVAVASPAPLLLAGPLAFVTGLRQIRSGGTHVRSASVLEQLAYAGTAIFSKSGILTTRNPEVYEVKSYKNHTQSEVLRIASALASQSQHPLARAIVKSAQTDTRVNKAKHAREVPGMGITGRMRGETFVIGRSAFLKTEGVVVPSSLASPNKTVVYVGAGNTLIGSITFTETLKDDADKLAAKLRKNGVRDIMIASNDTEKAVATVAKQTGIKIYHSDMVPADKIRLVEEAELRPVAFVGDTHSDAAALTASDISITLGSHEPSMSDIAIEDGSIKALKECFVVSRRTLKKARLVSLFGLTLTLILIAAASSDAFTPLQSASLQALVLLATVSTASYVNLKSA